MSRLFLLKAWKPLLGSSAVAYAAYGYYNWEQSKAALKLNKIDAKSVDKLFDKIDKDHSGSIDRDELKKELEEAGMTWASLRVDSMMSVADENHDGSVSLSEFRDLCERINAEGGAKANEAPPPSATKLLKEGGGTKAGGQQAKFGLDPELMKHRVEQAVEFDDHKGKKM